MFRKIRRGRQKCINPASSFAYDRLEQRNLLSVTQLFDGGQLSVDISDPMCVATLDVTDGIVTVNGITVDADAQPLAVEQVQRITFTGTDGLLDARVELDGDFNTGDLQDIEFLNINQVVLNGNYFVGNDVEVSVGGADGSFGGVGQLQAGANLILNPVDSTVAGFDVLLPNLSNDFFRVEVQTSGDVEIVDSNDIQLSNLTVNNLDVQVSGSITQAPSASIEVSGHTNLEGDSVDLGNNGSPVDLETLSAGTTGHFALNEATSVEFQSDSQLGSADIQAVQRITTDSFSSLNIDGDARLVANRLLLGSGFNTEFNAGRISFESVESAVIAEDSSIRLFGESILGNGGSISALGDLTATSDAVLDSSMFDDEITRSTSLFATGDIILGNELEGNIQIGRLEFSGQFVRLTLHGDVSLRGVSSANQLRLRSIFNEDGFGGITDERATTNIAGNATFIVSGGGDSEMNRVVLGDDTNLESFLSQSVSFAVEDGTFELTETDLTIISSESTFVNFAENVVINSAGDIINDPNARINVRGNSQFTGTNIVFGQPGNNDSVRLRSVTANTPGNLILDIFGAIELRGDSLIGGDAIIAPTSNVQSAVGSTFAVGGQASVFGPSIQLTRGTFSSSSLRFFTSGPVNISAIGDIVIAGNASHRAGNLRLTSTGSISNLPGATLDVDSPSQPGSLRLRAQGDITLGTNPGDRLTFNNLNFQTPGTVTINALFDQPQNQGRIFLYGLGNNRAMARELRLTTNVDVLDGTNTTLEVTDFLEISGRNIFLGDTDTDCLSVPDDANFITSQNAPVVTTDPSCPS